MYKLTLSFDFDGFSIRFISLFLVVNTYLRIKTAGVVACISALSDVG